MDSIQNWDWKKSDICNRGQLTSLVPYRYLSDVTDNVTDTGMNETEKQGPHSPLMII